MRRTTFVWSGIAVVALGLAAGAVAYGAFDQSRPTGQHAAAWENSGDGIAVVVNGHEVTRAEVNREIDATLRGALAQIPEERRAEVRSQLTARVTDSLIDRMLLEQEVAHGDFEVDDSAVSERVSQLRTALPDGQSLDQYVASIGMSLAGLEDAIETGLKIEALVERTVGASTVPTKEEIDAFYEEHREMFAAPERVEVRHILLAVEPGADDATRSSRREAAEKLRAQLLEGDAGEFGRLASLHSDCPSREKAGRLGTIQRGQTVEAFEEVAFEQEIGEIGEVVESPVGYHVIRVDDRRPAGLLERAEVEGFIVEQIGRERREAAVLELVEGLRSRAEIVYPSPEAA